MSIFSGLMKTTKLPKIFKFSVLWNILPYFGFLHEWKWILQSLNKKTQMMWNLNKDAFIYWGGRQKFKLTLNYNKATLKPIRDLELFTFETIVFCLVDSEMRCLYPDWFKYNIFIPLIDQLDEGKMILFDARTHEMTTPFSIWSKNEIEHIMQSTLWTYFNSDSIKCSK